MPPSSPRTYVCSTCGSNRVLLDAWAAWSDETQTWDLASTTQSAFCEDCYGETRILEKPLARPLPAPHS